MKERVVVMIVIAKWDESDEKKIVSHMINHPESWLITGKDTLLKEDSPPYLDFL